MNIFSKTIASPYPPLAKWRQQGVTLVEILMTIGIFLIVSSVLYLFITQGYRVQNFALDQSLAIAEARRGLESMVKEMREMQFADNGAYPIDTASDTEFTFYSDIDQDEAVERVRYFLENNKLKKGLIEPEQNPVVYPAGSEVVTSISQYVQNTSTPIFEYYNGDWPADTLNNPLGSPVLTNSVRFVRIILEVNARPAQAPSNFDLESNVQLRNLKDNL